MATRLYLDAVAAPTPISPSPDAAWEDVSLLQRLMTSTAKSGEAMSTVSIDDADDANKDFLLRQYVSPPLTPAQSITSAGSFEAQCRVSETFIANNMLLAVGIRVIASDGVTVRKTLSPVSRGATEAAVGSLVNRRWTDPAEETYTTVEGDRIVVEVGMGGTPGGTGSHSCSMRLGSASATDLPEDNIETSDYSPWVELPDTLTFDEEPTTTTIPPTTTVPPTTTTVPPTTTTVPPTTTTVPPTTTTVPPPTTTVPTTTVTTTVPPTTTTVPPPTTTVPTTTVPPPTTTVPTTTVPLTTTTIPTTTTVPPTTVPPTTTIPPTTTAPAVPHPADTGPGVPDWRCEPPEVLAYATDWLSGATPEFQGVSLDGPGVAQAYILRAADIALAHYEARYEDVGSAEEINSATHPQRWRETPDA